MIDQLELTTENRSPLGSTARRLTSKVALCTLYVVFAYAHLIDLVENGFRLSVALLVAFESVMVVLVFFRRDTSDVDLSTFAVFAGLVGSFAVLGFRPTGDGEDVLVGQVIQIAGALLQLGASFSLGRSFGLVPANRGIKTVGMYKIVRHPFYMAYLFTQAGYIVNNPSARNIMVMAIGTGFQVLRIRYEERLLLRDSEYGDYVDQVRWHLLPGVW
ncbi:MAG: methyltransferase family protein [Acidimicrobiales bacterium]